MKKTFVLVGIVIIVAGGVWYWVSTSRKQRIPQPTGQVTPAPISVAQNDGHLTIDETLRDVNFCGKIYKVKQIKIDGIDVVQRVAELVTNNLVPYNIGNGDVGATICDNIKRNSIDGVLKVGINKIPSRDFALSGDVVYIVPVSVEMMVIDWSANKIYGTSGYDGSLVGPIGVLK